MPHLRINLVTVLSLSAVGTVPTSLAACGGGAAQDDRPQGGGVDTSGGQGAGGGGGLVSGTGGLGDGGSAPEGGGGSVPTCDLPTSFSWTSSPALIHPKPPPGKTFASIKDPTIVSYEGRYHVFATVFETTAGSSGWKSVYLNFADFSEAEAAPQAYMQGWTTGHTVAPQVFFFTPHNQWYLVFQWNGRYSTNADINDPSGWSAPQQLLEGEPGPEGNALGALDFWVICDDDDCHLFFSRDDGKLYRSKVGIDDFPNFSGFEVVMEAPSSGLLFEASNVYKVDGTNKYLLLVEAFDNSPRFFRSWTSESLDGPWLPLADTKQNPFAGSANVTFEGDDWSDDVSHGEMIRSGHDEKLSINACNLRFLYQGRDPTSGGDYGLLPYRLGLLTLNR